MSDDLRRALRDLAAADAPGPVTPLAVSGLARRMRRRRRAGVATALLGIGVVVGLARPDAATRGLVVRPRPAGTPSDSPAETPVPPGTPAATPSGDPAGPASPSTTASPSPTASPTDGPTPSATPTTEPSYTHPPKPVCNLVVDALGDVQMNVAALDIVSGDVASGSGYVAAELRLRGSSDVPPDGATWTFGWRLGAHTYSFEATRSATQDTVARLVVTDDGGTSTTAPATAVFEGPRIHWTTPRANVPDLATATTFTGLRATTARGTAPATTTADQATSNATYTDQYPSCVKAG